MLEKEARDYEETYKEWAREDKERKRARNAEAGKKHYRKKMKQFSEAIEIPDYEKSDYERLRDKNIQEIEDMKKASGLFKKKDKM